MSNSKVILFPEENLKWPEQKVKALGVWFSNDPQISLSLNLLEKFGNGKKVPYLVESPKVKPNRENSCFKKPCGITASLCFDIPSTQRVYY